MNLPIFLRCSAVGLGLSYCILDDTMRQAPKTTTTSLTFFFFGKLVGYRMILYPRISCRGNVFVPENQKYSISYCSLLPLYGTVDNFLICGRQNVDTQVRRTDSGTSHRCIPLRDWEVCNTVVEQRLREAALNMTDDFSSYFYSLFLFGKRRLSQAQAKHSPVMRKANHIKGHALNAASLHASSH